MIEDSLIIDANPAELLAYMQRRVAHLEEIGKRLDGTLNDLVKASDRLLELTAPPQPRPKEA